MASKSPPRPPFLAIVVVGFQQLIAGKLWLAYTLLPAIFGVLFGLLSRLGNNTPEEGFTAIADLVMFGLIVPITCLMIGDRIVGAEIRAGSFVLTWLSPVRLVTIVLGRWLAGWLFASAVLTLSMALAAIAAGSPSNIIPGALAAIGSAAAYLAVFVLIGVWAKRAAIWALVYVFLFERLIGGPLSAVAQLSPQWLGRGLLASLGYDTSDLERDGVPEGTEALIRIAIISVVFLALAVWRLGSVRLSGSRD
jgi:ABC-type transport system involved in multi-copper enzyme maturation permease subunit